MADTARVAAALGVVDPPRTERELAERIEAFRPELTSTQSAREAARYLLLTPPLPVVARAPYGLLAATSVAMLPAMGTNAAAAALLSAGRSHRSSGVGSCRRRRNTVGVDRYPLSQSRHSTMSYAPSE